VHGDLWQTAREQLLALAVLRLWLQWEMRPSRPLELLLATGRWQLALDVQVMLPMARRQHRRRPEHMPTASAAFE